MSPIGVIYRVLDWAAMHSTSAMLQIITQLLKFIAVNPLCLNKRILLHGYSGPLYFHYSFLVYHIWSFGGPVAWCCNGNYCIFFACRLRVKIGLIICRLRKFGSNFFWMYIVNSFSEIISTIIVIVIVCVDMFWISIWCFIKVYCFLSLIGVILSPRLACYAHYFSYVTNYNSAVKVHWCESTLPQ